MSVTLDVQGKIFKTNYGTIIKIPYFKDMFESCGPPTETIFIDRPSHIFKHVMGLATDPFYQYPEQYISELDFYNVDVSEIKVYNKLQNILTDIHFLKNKCRDQRCDKLSVEGSQFCASHHRCPVSDCRNSVTSPTNNYCYGHHENGIYCDFRGCYKLRTDTTFCDEHGKI
jgi:hypothetical protein